MQKSVFRRAIILSWICLVVCFIIKLFGGNWFEIVVADERFIKAGNYIDNSVWAKIAIGATTTFIANEFYYLAICQKTKFNITTNAYILTWSIIASFIKAFLGNEIGLICDIFQFAVMPCILLGKPSKKYLRVIVANVLNISFQLISAFTKNIGIKFIDDNILIGIIFALDMYIMLILYYIYSQHKNLEV